MKEEVAGGPAFSKEVTKVGGNPHLNLKTL